MIGRKIKSDKPSTLLSKGIQFFFLKLFALVVIWECSYHFILQPSQIPDKQLTNIITSGTIKFINLYSPASFVYTYTRDLSVASDFIFQNNKLIFIIADGCNGLSLIAIYLGFIILMPYPIKRKIIFGIGGVIILTIANIIRCTLLYWIFKKYPASFDFNHHYLFSILMYLLIFYGWILFTKRGKVNEAY
jgi:exosortase/archaeosortase family protein